jgi:methionyl-tRNA formyltransferase
LRLSDHAETSGKEKKILRVIFFGTPEFALPSLRAIHQSVHTIAAVVTIPDKQQGRGLKLIASPVKQFAVENNIPCLQPDSLTDRSFINQLESFKADVFVVVAFRILPEAVYSLPKFGSFNVHASLLPKYRGAAPIQWAIMCGEQETGVTTFKLEKKVDTGNLYLQKTIAIEPGDSGGTLHDALSVLGAAAVVETLAMIARKKFKLIEQDNELATPAPKITKELCEINWNVPAKRIVYLIRAMSPYPAAFFTHKNIVYKVFKAEEVKNGFGTAGTITETSHSLIIGAAENAVSILEIQQQGRKRMPIAEFLRGHSLTR